MHKMYRYESCKYNVTINADIDFLGVSASKLLCREYFIHSETPKGYWIGYLRGSKDKWVSKTSRKRFAHTTKREALEAYRYRKASYVKHATNALKKAKSDLALYDRELLKLETGALED